MSISENLRKLYQEIPDRVKVVAVSKTHPVELIREAYEAGHRIFGENRVNELLAKSPFLPADTKWHFIGHLQRNKVKHMISKADLIHSIDSPQLLLEVNKEAFKANRLIDCLLQFHIAKEETKYGFDFEEAVRLLNSTFFHEMKFVRICGVMGMATFTDDQAKVGAEFNMLAAIFRRLKDDFFSRQPTFKEISMGMSADYKTAIEQGSTIIRIGTAIFGERNYH